jgi:hypothetical protein
MDPVLDAVLVTADDELLAYTRASTGPEERDNTPEA